jgi:hypothetical protein
MMKNENTTDVREWVLYHKHVHLSPLPVAVPLSGAHLRLTYLAPSNSLSHLSPLSLRATRSLTVHQ